MEALLPAPLAIAWRVVFALVYLVCYLRWRHTKQFWAGFAAAALSSHVLQLLLTWLGALVVEV